MIISTDFLDNVRRIPSTKPASPIPNLPTATATLPFFNESTTSCSSSGNKFPPTSSSSPSGNQTAIITIHPFNDSATSSSALEITEPLKGSHMTSTSNLTPPTADAASSSPGKSPTAFLTPPLNESATSCFASENKSPHFSPTPDPVSTTTVTISRFGESTSLILPSQDKLPPPLSTPDSASSPSSVTPTVSGPISHFGESTLFNSTQNKFSPTSPLPDPLSSPSGHRNVMINTPPFNDPVTSSLILQNKLPLTPPPTPDSASSPIPDPPSSLSGVSPTITVTTPPFNELTTSSSVSQNKLPPTSPTPIPPGNQPEIKTFSTFSTPPDPTVTTSSFNELPNARSESQNKLQKIVRRGKLWIKKLGHLDKRTTKGDSELTNQHRSSPTSAGIVHLAIC